MSCPIELSVACMGKRQSDRMSVPWLRHPPSSYLAAIILILVLIAQFYVAVAPLGGTASAGEAVQSFFLAYLAFPILLIFFITGAIYKGRIMPLRAHEIDLMCVLLHGLYPYPSD